MRLDVTFQKSDNPFVVALNENEPILAEFEDGSCSFDALFIGGEAYDGDYIATPKVSEQTLPTAGKSMAQNVTVKAIPYSNVINPSGGHTIHIGNEV